MSFLLDVAYAAGLAVLSPVWLYRMIRHGRYRSGIAQRLGAAPVRHGLQPTIWIHGVSLGEINAARTLVAEIHRQLPDYRVVVSSTTDTGMTAARKLFAPDHIVFQWPLDFTLSVRAALRRIRPSLVVTIKGEVWPNFLAACNRCKVPVVVVNGRMSADKGYPRYKLLGPLAAKLFNRLTAIGVQDVAYAARFQSLGVDADRVQVTGMLKYDTAGVADHVEGDEALSAAMGLTVQDRLIVAGGTGPGEEAILLDLYRRLKAKHAQARLAIVPRKPERFDEVARLITSASFPLMRRTEHADGLGTGEACRSALSEVGRTAGETPATRADKMSTPPVLLGDTMGELRKFYSLATYVFVGRSLVPMGGSDMIESAALGKATAFGPHTFNFPQAADLARNGCVQVADAAALERQLDAWLSDPTAAGAAGKQAQQFVRSQQGATKRNVEMICRVLGRVPAMSEGGIATDAIG